LGGNGPHPGGQTPMVDCTPSTYGNLISLQNHPA